MTQLDASKKRLRVLIGSLLMLALAGLILLPTLRRSLEEARRIEAQTQQIDAAAKQAKQSASEFDTLQQQVERNPNDATLRLRYASLLGQQRRYPEAIQQAKEAARVAPTLAEPHLALGEIYQSNYLYDLALDEVRQAVALEPKNPRALAQLGYLYIGLDWNVAAERVLSQAVKDFPNDNQIRTVYAQTLYQMQNHRGALEQILQAKQGSPDNYALDGPLIDVYMQLEKPQEALEAAQKALAHEPGNAGYHLGVARAQRKLRNFTAARDAARNALEIQPNSADAHFELALALKQEGKEDEAQRELQAVLERSPGHDQASLLLSQRYMRQGKPEEAKRVRSKYEELRAKAEARIRRSLRVGNYPDDAEAHFELGRAYLEVKEYPRAIVEFKETLRLRPEKAEAKPLLAEALRAIKRSEEADAIIPLSPR